MHLIFKFLAKKLNIITFRTIFIVVLFHILVSYAGFLYLKEDKLTKSYVNYVYYYTVTASTIGYGDMSPQTENGRLFALLFLIPISVSLFATTITKAITTMSDEINKIKNGYGDYTKMKNHLIIMGGTHLDKLLYELSYNGVVVLSTNHIDNADVHFIKTDSLSNIDDLYKCGILNCDKVIIIGKDDNETLLASLAVSSIIGESKHVVAYFNSSNVANILEKNCSNIETIVNNTIEQVARSLETPGASHVIYDLISKDKSASIYSYIHAEGIVTPLELSIYLLKEHNFTLIGHGSKENPTMILNNTDLINNGDVIYYLLLV